MFESDSKMKLCRLYLCVKYLEVELFFLSFGHIFFFKVIYITDILMYILGVDVQTAKFKKTIL